MRKFRILHYMPATYRVQRKGKLWGWNWLYKLDDFGEYDIADFYSIEEAEEAINKVLKREAHVVRVIKEYP